MAEQIVELAPGESKVVSFEATPSQEKIYTVKVDGLAGNFSTIHPSPLIGDLNDDGAVDFTDLDILKAYIAGIPVATISPLSENEFRRRADINRDGRINILDVSALEKQLSSGVVTISDCNQIGNWLSDPGAVMKLDTEIKHSGTASIRQDVLDVTMWFNCRHLIWQQPLDMSNWLAYSFWHRCTVPTVLPPTAIPVPGQLLEFYSLVSDEDGNFWAWFLECRANIWELINVSLREPDNASSIPPNLSRIAFIQITHTPGGAPPFSSWIDELAAELSGGGLSLSQAYNRRPKEAGYAHS